MVEAARLSGYPLRRGRRDGWACGFAKMRDWLTVITLRRNWRNPDPSTNQAPRRGAQANQRFSRWQAPNASDAWDLRTPDIANGGRHLAQKVEHGHEANGGSNVPSPTSGMNWRASMKKCGLLHRSMGVLFGLHLKLTEADLTQKLLRWKVSQKPSINASSRTLFLPSPEQ